MAAWQDFDLNGWGAAHAAFPALVNGGLSWSDWKGTPVGPFLNGSNLYVVLVDQIDYYIEVWKSTDGGATWIQQDEHKHPPCSPLATEQAVAAFQSGVTLYIAYVARHAPVFAGSTVPSALVTFDMSTDTYGTVDFGGPGVGMEGTTPPSLFVVVRSDGDVILLYPKTDGTNAGVFYARREAGVWTNNIQVSTSPSQGAQVPIGALLGSSDRSHFFWFGSSVGANDLSHRSLTSGNVLNTEQQPSGIDGVFGGVGTTYADGADTKLVFPHAQISDFDLIVLRGVSADDPSWTVEDVIPAPSLLVVEAEASNPGATVMDGTIVHVFFPERSTDDIFRNSDGGAGAWGTEVEYKDAVTCQGIGAVKLASEFGVLYDDGGAVMFDTAPLVAAAAELKVLALMGVGR